MTAQPMTVPASTRRARRPPRPLARALGAEALALAIMSVLHLSGALGGGHKPFVRSDAGIAEAIICVLLAAGAWTLARGRPRSGLIASATVVWAILGFCIGLHFSVQAGDPIDLAFHATMLPVLAITLIGLRRA